MTKGLIKNVTNNAMRSAGAVVSMRLADKLPIANPMVKGAVLLGVGSLIQDMAGKQISPLLEGVAVSGGIMLAGALLPTNGAPTVGRYSGGQLTADEVNAIEAAAASDGVNGRQSETMMQSVAGLDDWAIAGM